MAPRGGVAREGEDYQTLSLQVTNYQFPSYKLPVSKLQTTCFQAANAGITSYKVGVTEGRKNVSDLLHSIARAKRIGAAREYRLLPYSAG